MNAGMVNNKVMASSANSIHLHRGTIFAFRCICFAVNSLVNTKEKSAKNLSKCERRRIYTDYYLQDKKLFLSCMVYNNIMVLLVREDHVYYCSIVYAMFPENVVIIFARCWSHARVSKH